jgi:hypothetical protein
MGSGDNVIVNTDELARLANELRQSAGAVQGSLENVTDNLFGVGSNGKEPEAGRNYTAQGRKIHDGLEQLGKRLQEWTTAGSALADAFGKSAMTYEIVDTQNANNQNKAT